MCFQTFFGITLTRHKKNYQINDTKVGAALKKADKKKKQEALKYKFSNSKVLPYRVDYYVHCNVLCLEVTGKLKDTNRQCRSGKLSLFHLVILGLSHTQRTSNANVKIDLVERRATLLENNFFKRRRS